MPRKLRKTDLNRSIPHGSLRRHDQTILDACIPTTMLRSDLAERELQRSLLTYRLLCHEARTQTICRFTSLTEHQIETYRRRWGFRKECRSRGPSPTSFATFFRSQKVRIESTQLALLCKAHGLLDSGFGTHTFYTAERAEQLCDVIELQETAHSHPTFSFDQLVLLVKGLSASVNIKLEPCRSCGKTVLIDAWASVHSTCDFCIDAGEKSSRTFPDRQSAT